MSSCSGEQKKRRMNEGAVLSDQCLQRKPMDHYTCTYIIHSIICFIFKDRRQRRIPEVREKKKKEGRRRNKREGCGYGQKRGRKKWIKKKKTEEDRFVCRLLQSHCTTLEFQTRTMGRAESREQSRGERGEGGEERRVEERRGEGANGKLTLEANRRQAGEEGRNEIS